RNLLNAGKPSQDALRETWHTTGKAILTTSVVLIGGFGSFAFSSFQSTFLTGTLVSAALLAAVFADLVLLVALIVKCYPAKPPSRGH
ncbi:MAG: MMPL family transporter, partial [Bacteroidota bacterium]